MNMREIYEKMNGDYDTAISRLRDDERIKKYLLKFRDNRLDLAIKKALDEKDYENAFMEAHNLKGVCANLNMDALCNSASELTEALRSRDPQGDISPLVEAMQRDYDMTMMALNELAD